MLNEELFDAYRLRSIVIYVSVAQKASAAQELLFYGFWKLFF
jgi:hypothetical protein